MQALNSIYSHNLGAVWTLNEAYAEEGSELQYIQAQSQRQARPFDTKNFDWVGDVDSFIDLTGDSSEMADGTDSTGPSEAVTGDSELSFLEVVNRTKLDNKEDILCGDIADLPAELLPLLREELLNNFTKESFEVSFPNPRPSASQIQESLKRHSPDKQQLQCLFELLQAVHGLITKPAQKQVLWSLLLSPEITGLELEKKFGLFTVSHLKIADPKEAARQKQLEGADWDGKSN